MHVYVPIPKDTSDVVLPQELIDLAETIAENVHEVWAQNRMKEGWSYGPIRNDSLKQSPCLVPYGQLPEIEKTYDRNTAFETLKLIYQLGYKIVRDEK